MPADSNQPPRLLFIGLDSATPALLKRWCDEGVLPTLASLRAAGRTVRITGPPGFGQVSLWTSLNSSIPVGGHGCYAIQRLDPRSYTEGRLSVQNDFPVDTFWQSLSRAGHPVGVVDLVRAPLADLPRGFQVCDWLTHQPIDPPCSAPATLVGDLVRRYGSDPLEGDVDTLIERGSTVEEVHRRLQTRLDIKEQGILELLGKGEWSLFATAFSEPHDLGHCAWHLHDRDHPNFDGETAARLGDPVRALYRRVDRSLAAFLNAAGNPLTTVVVAGPGISPLATANNVLDRILMRLDRPWMRHLWGRFPPKKSKRRFFPLQHNTHAGAVRINLMGREPHGIVHPDDLKKVIDGLVADIGALRNADGDGPVVDRIVVVREHTSGQMLDYLPDLLVIWRRDRPIESVWSPKTGTVRARWFPKRSGDHTDEVELLVHTSEGAPSDLPDTMPVEDIAPSICGHFGVAMPEAAGTAHPLVG